MERATVDKSLYVPKIIGTLNEIDFQRTHLIKAT